MIDWIEYVLRPSYHVTDIGQIDGPTRRRLDKMVRDGELVTGTSYEFPVNKRFWIRADHIGMIPGPIHFAT